MWYVVVVSSVISTVMASERESACNDDDNDATDEIVLCMAAEWRERLHDYIRTWRDTTRVSARQLANIRWQWRRDGTHGSNTGGDVLVHTASGIIALVDVQRYAGGRIRFLPKTTNDDDDGEQFTVDLGFVTRALWMVQKHLRTGGARQMFVLQETDTTCEWLG